jgi:hypothetical protein
MPTNGDFPWERDARARRPRHHLSFYAGSVARGATRLAVVAVIAIVVITMALGARGGFDRGAHAHVPGAYVAVPGPWHWRWVRVLHPPPGTPKYIRQRYRTIRYVGASPSPAP